MGTSLAIELVQDQEGDVDSRRARLQLRLVEAVMHHAAPKDRGAMTERALSILDDVASEIAGEPDPELADLLAAVRAEVEPGANRD